MPFDINDPLVLIVTLSAAMLAMLMRIAHQEKRIRKLETKDKEAKND
jgi:hypothetical protein